MFKRYYTTIKNFNFYHLKISLCYYVYLKYIYTEGKTSGSLNLNPPPICTFKFAMCKNR